ncbi:hypothetical protein OIU79_030603 [Salix purpurea]|uniref:Uncharacterized protein n=1 Tax=Salix purpurea TaxID=77065 RepID=A0A9Q0V999_SALPP|nr:hypothetical protein OIU79_030603 [Salix purpurea]
MLVAKLVVAVVFAAVLLMGLVGFSAFFIRILQSFQDTVGCPAPSNLFSFLRSSSSKNPRLDPSSDDQNCEKLFPLQKLIAESSFTARLTGQNPTPQDADDVLEIKRSWERNLCRNLHGLYEGKRSDQAQMNPSVV